MASLFLSIGSNIDPEFHFQQCAITLKKAFNNPVWSPVYRSAAVGMDGNDFLNAVVSAKLNLSTGVFAAPINLPAEHSILICCYTMIAFWIQQA